MKRDNESDNQQSNEHSNESEYGQYFSQIPEIVLAGTDPYETRFWLTVKMIAGTKGKCYAGIRLLAQLSNMSRNKANQCRKNLIKRGLLQGGPKDKNNRNSEWTIIVPNLREANSNWRLNIGDSLYDRACAYTTFWQDGLWKKKNGKLSYPEPKYIRICTRYHTEEKPDHFNHIRIMQNEFDRLKADYCHGEYLMELCEAFEDLENNIEAEPNNRNWKKSHYALTRKYLDTARRRQK